MRFQPAAALLAALAVLAGCMPLPGNEPLTPREKREAIEDSMVTQKVREDADLSTQGVCGTATGAEVATQRGGPWSGPLTDPPHMESCPP